MTESRADDRDRDLKAFLRPRSTRGKFVSDRDDTSRLMFLDTKIVWSLRCKAFHGGFRF